MKRRLRDYRTRALAFAIVAIGIGCLTVVPVAWAGLRTEQTVAMVRAGRFTALNGYYAAVQASYDKGAVSDEQLRSAFRHFYDRSPDLAGRYAVWVKEMPGSYVAHLARAIYYLKVGQASRGNLVIADTSEAQLSGMDTAFAVASQELRKSFPLDRKPLLSVFYALDIGKFGGDAAHNLELLHASVAIDPRNFIVREMYEQTLQTAWGGSTDEIRAFVAQCKRAGLPAAQMKALRSVVYADEAWIDEFDNKSYKRAAAEYLEAAKLSGDDTCVLCAGKMLAKAGDFPDSARVLTRYLARHPDSADALETRAYVYFELKRGSDAVRDCKRAAPLGDSYCQYTVGMAYTFGVYGLPKDLDAAVPWLRRAAAQGYPIAKQLLPIALAEQLAHPHPIGATRSPAS